MAIVARTDDSDYSPTWKWSDEEELAGAHVEFRLASMEHGEAVVWEIDSEGHGPVSVWLEPANLKLKVQRELGRRLRERGASRLEPGERVRLNPGTKRPSKRNASQTIWPFPLVEFEHGVPDMSAEEFLLAGAVEPDNGEEALEEAVAPPPIPEQELVAGGAQGRDDIPFAPAVI